MDLDEVASFLQRDGREVMKLASRGHLPGRRVGGRWRFDRAEITHWIEAQMHAYTEQELATLERRTGRPAGQALLVSVLLTADTTAVPLRATTRPSVIKGMAELAGRSPHVYDVAAVEHAVQKREEMGSTALDTGVAILHPRRALVAALADSVIAFGRTASGIPFGGPAGRLTDLFFLVCCVDDVTHLRVLARLSRLFLRPAFVDELREAGSAAEAFGLIAAAEQDLIED